MILYQNEVITMSKTDPDPTAITFIIATDYTDKKCSKVCDHVRKFLMETMTTVVESTELNDFEIIARDQSGFKKKLMEKNIPLLGFLVLPDVETGPCLDDYYVVDYEDGSRQLYIILPPTYEERQHDMAYR